MPQPAIQALVRRLARGAAGGAGDVDPELLRRFAADRDEGAFAELVERHGPMVLDVCRAALGNHADAEDAFQATFLLLARNAGTIRRPSSLAAWLHGVAYRTARKARVRAARRREREARAPVRDQTAPDDLSWIEVRRAVHEALAALGERYRAPLVLCYLGGMTQESAAAALGLSFAAVKKRLERGREMLRAALTRRGFGPTALLAVVAAPAAAVAPALAESTAQSAVLFAADPISAALPTRVAGLIHGGNSMTPVKLLSALLFSAVAVGLVLAGTPAAPDTRAENPSAAPVPTKGKPEPPADREAKWPVGAWTVAFVEESGKSAFAGDEPKDARITFQDGAAMVEGFELLFFKDFSFKLDPAKQPKEIDVTFRAGEMKGKTFAGIYVTLKNEVRVCLRLKQTDRGRPKGFATVSGAGLYTFFLRPADGKAPPPPRITPDRDPKDVFQKVCEAVAALEGKHELLKGVSKVIPVVERDEQKRLRSASFIFQHNAIARGKQAARAEDDSKPFVYVSVSAWAGRSQQPPADLHEFEWKGQTYQMWVQVYGSDDKLVGAVRGAAIPPPAPPGVQPATPASPGGAKAPVKTSRVVGTLASSEYAKAGGSIERCIVSVLTDPDRKQIAHSNTKRLVFPVAPDFDFALPPGKYVLECTAVGSRGATFVPTAKTFTVTEKVVKLDLGAIDLPASKVTKLFGKPAPELDGIVAWKNTEPLTMKALKGKVVVLDFWSYSCSICLHHKPDLVKLLEKYKDKGLAVLTVHDGSAETMEDVDKKVPEVVKQKTGHLPVALDRAGGKGVFGTYGITAVPMVILIDAEGNVVRRFHHAGDPELDKEVGRLLKAEK